MADYWLGEGLGFLPIIHHAFNQTLLLVRRAIKTVESITGERILEGVESLTTRKARSYWSSLTNDEARFLADFSRQIVVVRGNQRTSAVHPILYGSSAYISLVYGLKNDGALAVSSQKVPFLVTPPIDLGGDHISTVLPRELSGVSSAPKIRLLSSFLLAVQ